MDYNSYQISLKEYIVMSGIVLAATMLVAFLFYNTWYGMILFPFFFLLCRVNFKKYRKGQRNQELLIQFKDAIHIACNSLQSGYSMENAWIAAEREMEELYGKGSLMVIELHRMNEAIGLNLPLERLLADFARRSGIDEIQNFSEVFSFAKRSGGNIVQIMKTTTDHIQESVEVKREIEVLISAKKFEQMILNVVPIGILFYLRFSSLDYLNVLYGNGFGIAFMTGCFILYGVAIYVSQKIMDIQV